jgi:hypothetical protein
MCKFNTIDKCEKYLVEFAFSYNGVKTVIRTLIIKGEANKYFKCSPGGVV